jgi:hypothetical protein
MKRIVDGVAYNTDTSTRLAQVEKRAQDERGRDVDSKAVLYETNKGAFFIHKAHETEWFEKKSPWFVQTEQKKREWHEFIPMTADEARTWMLKGDVEVIHDRFAEGVPEAEPETEQGATIYLRVPTTLKRRVDQAANAASLSINAWVMRCVEEKLAASSWRKGNKTTVATCLGSEANPGVSVPEKPAASSWRKADKTKVAM